MCRASAGAARRRLTTLAPVLALVAALPAAAEEGDAPRPRVALVLSGGGARGGAHIGVLRVLEEMRVPVDCVVGASIGSIAGGLYASGLAPEEMGRALAGVDWSAAMIDEPDRQQMSFRRKEDDRLALLPLELGVGLRGISQKTGFLSGYKIEFILRALTLHAHHLESFDALRLPFRAVAADLDTGAAVALSEGDLPKAMRASMAIPGIFTPVTWEGRLLVDGGIANNLPVDVGRDLCGERVIAVDVGTPPAGASQGMSGFAVFNQMLSVVTDRNVQEQRAMLGEEDLLIVPDLEGISSGNFAQMISAAEVGERAARQAADRLAAFSVSEEEYAEYLRRQRLPEAERQAVIRPARIRLEGVPERRREMLLGRLRSRPGEALRLDLLARDVATLHQSGEYEQVTFDVIPGPDGSTLVFHATPKSWGPGYLRFGLGVESAFSGESDFRAIVHYRRPDINRLGAEWKAIVGLGSPSTAFTEFFQPLERRRVFFTAPYLEYRREKSLSFVPDGEQEYLDSERGYAGLDLGFQISNWGELRFGVVRGTYRADALSGSTLPGEDVDLGGWRLRGTLDQLDSPFFPRKGNLSHFDLYVARDNLGSDEEYERLEFSSSQYGRWGKNTLFGGLRFGTDFGSDIPFYDEFRLGGFLNLSGLAPGELQGDVSGLLTLGYYWQVWKLGSFGGIYAGAALQGGNVWDSVEEAELGDLRFSGTLFAGADLRYLPVYFAYGRAEGGADAFYIYIGQLFR